MAKGIYDAETGQVHAIYNKELIELIDKIRNKADDEYDNYMEQLKKEECLCFEAKIEKGKFGKSELIAYSKGFQFLGRHRAFHEAANMIEELLKGL